MTKKKFERYVKAGRGQKKGSQYHPWLTIHDFSSMGNSHRLYSWKLKRIVHLFSDNELALFYILEQMKNVVDIREQFPLLPPEEILHIAGQCNNKWYKRLQNRELMKGVIYIPTSDFRVTMRHNSHVFDVVFTVKPVAKLTNHQYLKFEVEKRYLKRRNIKFFIVTDEDLKFYSHLFRNIKFLRPFRSLNDYPLNQTLSEHLRYDIISYLTESMLEKCLLLREITRLADEKFNVVAGTSLMLANHLIANQWWHINMLQPYNPTEKVCLLAATITCLTPQAAQLDQ